MVPKIKVKLASGYTCYNDATYGFYINQDEEKEVYLTNNIQILITKRILIIV